MRTSFRLLLILLITQPVWAVKHINPGAYPNAKHDDVHVFTPAEIRKAGSLHAASIAGATGTRKIAVIIVQFPAGQAALISGNRLIQSFANIDTYFTQLISYYNETSYGKLTLTTKFYGNLGFAQNSAVAAGAYTMTQPSEYYGCGDEGVGCAGVTTPTPGQVNANGNYLIAEAINAAKLADPTFNDTVYDDVLVVHAGNGNETTSSNGDVWSIFYSQDNVIQATGTGFDEGITIPETELSLSSPLGVMAHEYGHALGLPDLYNTGSAGGNSVAGNWELMDSGPYVGGGSNPAHHSAWCKYQLGWATAQNATAKGTYTLPYVETAAGGTDAIIKINVQNSTFPNEYFLVEYRAIGSGALYDRNIPGTGVLIWHIDDDITGTRGVRVTDQSLANTVNTGIPHYGVSLITANGVGISNSNQGSAGNAYGNQGVFTSPASNNFLNEPSGASLVNISGVGGATVSFEIANLAVRGNQTIHRVDNYPNPAGKGYAHSSGEDHSTIQFQLARPAGDYSINLYTLSGDLVRKVTKDQITLNITRSSDEKWVYEYDWDLKNGDGSKVAPGVYFYLVRADGHKKTGKAVIIR